MSDTLRQIARAELAAFLTDELHMVEDYADQVADKLIAHLDNLPHLTHAATTVALKDL